MNCGGMNTMTKSEALRILGLGNKYTLDEVKKAYRVLAKKYHPDVAGPSASQMFTKINEANNLLNSLGEQSGCVLTHKNIFDM